MAENGQNAQDIRAINETLGDFRAEVSRDLGRLLAGQARTTELLDQHEDRLNIHDNVIDHHLHRIAENKKEAGSAKTFGTFGAGLAILVGLVEVFLHWFRGK